MIIRLLIPACILLSTCALSYAQKTEQNPLDRVLKELEAGRTENAIAALDELIKQNPNDALRDLIFV